WPFVDPRTSLDGRDLLQAAVKPIYPTQQYLQKNRPSAREVIGRIIGELIGELNARMRDTILEGDDIVPLRRSEGGKSSIDIMRQDTNKARAARDLIRNFFLEEEPELVLAMDDEMAPLSVGFPFLQVKGITVLSMENTKNGEKRVYPPDIAEKIQAFWLWTQECGLGVEVDATKNVFRLLLETWEQEMQEFVTGQKSLAEPAIRRLKNTLIQKKKDAQSQVDRPLRLKKNFFQNLIMTYTASI
ncbi:MAG: hypothetical protein NC924_08920, partial [Candidatus Omnitrophica bacterium]|nr:hypothetical protein [Candidatus Omnitrophota bacterium]